MRSLFGFGPTSASIRSLTWLVCALVLVAAGGTAMAQSSQPATDATLIEKLKRGGYNLYVRHAATDWSQSDKIAVRGDWVSCDPKKVRQLSDAGRRDARQAEVEALSTERESLVVDAQ